MVSTPGIAPGLGASQAPVMSVSLCGRKVADDRGLAPQAQELPGSHRFRIESGSLVRLIIHGVAADD